jgi:cytochrome c oxidase cbb3-type subunit 3
MRLNMRKKIKFVSIVLAMMIMAASPVWAAGPPQPSPFSNPLTVSLVSLMIVLLIIIGILANILLGVADVRLKKDKKKKEVVKIAASIAIAFALSTNQLFAQDGNATITAVNTIGGMSSVVFYIMSSVIFLELLVILVLLMNVRGLLKAEKEKLATELNLQKVRKSFTASWWNRLNSFKPVEQEADIDLGHDYDGIRELDNRLPPWWIYGFYLTIVIAGIYLWRFHVSHTAPSSKEEYESSVLAAEHDIKEYLAKKGESVDENTVTILSAPDDIAAGKTIFTTSCVACHKESGGGDVGPNLTDDYWMHGGDIKSVFKTIRYGVNAMPQWQNSYSNKQIAQVASYVKSLKGTNPPNAKAPQGEIFKEDSSPAKPATDSVALKENKLTANQ